MISKYAKGKVSVFIDASNIYYSQKKLKWHIDFKKFLDYLKQELDLQEIYYYTARDLSFFKQTKFIAFLESIGYEVRSKKVKFIKSKNKDKIKDGFYKGNLDVELTIDVLETKNKYDALILVSGDSDFEPLLQLMKRKYNKKCLVMATKHNISIELIKCAKYINLNKLKKYIIKV
ncbi:NYN domain-containing protein [Candidatus Parcubacteria bacterium]|nr:NYN domain-containing protein [Candidatus Parcubacteria bacterium]